MFTFFHGYRPSLVVTDFSDGVVVGHIGGIVARLVDGHASELLDGAVQLEPALIN